MFTLEAADAVIAVSSRTGCVSSLRLGKGRSAMTRRSPAGYLEVADLSSRGPRGRKGCSPPAEARTYDPLGAKFTLSDWKETSARGKKALSFVQQYEGAPFEIRQTFRQTPAGVRWEASIRLLPGQESNRSVRVTWVLPIPRGWAFWAPQDTEVRRNDGMTPQRYVYGHISFRPYGTMIPLVGTWPLPRRGGGGSRRSRGSQAGLVAFSPPDVQKPYISFDLDTQSAPASVRGISHEFADVPHLRVAHHLVGLRPGKDLRLAVCLAGVQPHWRCALGHYVRSYPELFEPIPATRKVEGMYGITTPTRLAQGQLEQFKAAGVTFVEVHGHFPEYSVYITPEAMKDPQLTWRCRPHLGKQLSLADNRQWITKLNQAGIAPFMYWYNCHADPKTIRKLWPDELMRDEAGRVLIKYRKEPALHGTPESPYGKHLIEQMELLLKAYPRTAGFFVDNYAIEMLDFAHDDGVTMVHDRPAYDLNQNHIRIGPICFEKAHKAGKIIMVNKISTIESLRGADMVLAETRGVASVRKHALACVYRPLFPLKMELPEGPHGAERGLQHLLLTGCTPDEALYREDPETMRAYRPLTDAMIGKRWVLEFDPLDVPAGLEGQIFRIDKHAPHGGDVVVVLVDLTASWKDGAPEKQAAETAKQARRAEALSVTVRLADASAYKKATWLAVEDSHGRPRPCKMTRRAGGAITIKLPPVGAAGILRLGR